MRAIVFKASKDIEAEGIGFVLFKEDILIPNIPTKEESNELARLVVRILLRKKNGKLIG